MSESATKTWGNTRRLQVAKFDIEVTYDVDETSAEHIGDLLEDALVDLDLSSYEIRLFTLEETKGT